jgi:hypothetical protein
MVRGDFGEIEIETPALPVKTPAVSSPPSASITPLNAARPAQSNPSGNTQTGLMTFTVI